MVFNETTFFRSFSPIFNGIGAENAQRGWLTPHSPLSQARPKLDESGGGEGRRVMETNVVVLVFWKQSDNRRLLILWCVLDCACMLFATWEKLVGSGRHVQVTATSIIDFTEISPARRRKTKAGRRRDEDGTLFGDYDYEIFSLRLIWVCSLESSELVISGT